MESATKSLPVPINQAVAPEQCATPYALETVVITKQEYIDLKSKASYFDVQHKK